MIPLRKCLHATCLPLPQIQPRFKGQLIIKKLFSNFVQNQKFDVTPSIHASYKKAPIRGGGPR